MYIHLFFIIGMICCWLMLLVVDSCWLLVRCFVSMMSVACLLGVCLVIIGKVRLLTISLVLVDWWRDGEGTFFFDKQMG